MFKRILLFIFSILFIFLIGYFTNKHLVDTYNSSLVFPLINIYVFLAISSIIIYVLTELVIQHLPNETGYLYLALTMIKMGVFVLLFQDNIFSEHPLSKADKFSLVIPFLLFLIIEAVAVAKLLNNKDYTTSPSNKDK